MTPRPDPRSPGSVDRLDPVDRVERFDRTERILHWANAVVVAVLIATAAALYIDALAVLVGRRGLVRQVHVVAGLGLPLPLVVALTGPWRRRLRADATALARWDDVDRHWLRHPRTTPAAGWAKFSAGQKLNAAVTLGLLGILLGTGSILHWFAPFPLEWRTGATFVHDVAALALVLLVAGHVVKAMRDGDALRSIVAGWVPVEWARRRRPRWLPTGDESALAGRADGGPAGRPPPRHGPEPVG